MNAHTGESTARPRLLSPDQTGKWPPPHQAQRANAHSQRLKAMLGRTIPVNAVRPRASKTSTNKPWIHRRNRLNLDTILSGRDPAQHSSKTQTDSDEPVDLTMEPVTHTLPAGEAPLRTPCRSPGTGIRPAANRLRDSCSTQKARTIQPRSVAACAMEYPGRGACSEDPEDDP